MLDQHIENTAAGQADSGGILGIGGTVANAVDPAPKFTFLQAFQKILFHTAAGERPAMVAIGLSHQPGTRRPGG